jgi:hypothetical protein
MSPITIEQLPEAPAAAGAERRRFARFRKPPTIASGDWNRVFDISLGGICLEGQENVRPGDQLDLILTDEDCFYTATIAAEVVWKSGEMVGCRWIAPDDGQRDWLQGRMRGGRSFTPPSVQLRQR